MDHWNFVTLFSIDAKNYSKQKIVLRYVSEMHRFFYRNQNYKVLRDSIQDIKNRCIFETYRRTIFCLE